ncbi:MAG TPA: hypothetical protein VK698_39560 [Kofleriaceae bacterium]|nr:hypothetical protein [Kofleriaceae bacterium]
MTTPLYVLDIREDDDGIEQPNEALFTPTPENAAEYGFMTRDGIHLTGVGEEDEPPTEFVALGHNHTWTALALLADAWMRKNHPDADLPVHTRPPVRKHAVFITHPHPDHPCGCAWDGQWRLVYAPATEPGAVAVTVIPAGRTT